MSHGTYAHQIEQWHVLVNNLESAIEEVPHARADREELRQMMDEMQRLCAEIEVANGQLRGLIKRRQKLAYAARQKRLVLAAHLKAHFGFDYPRLVAFGIEPRTPRKRTKKVKVGGEGKKE